MITISKSNLILFKFPSAFLLLQPAAKRAVSVASRVKTSTTNKAQTVDSVYHTEFCLVVNDADEPVDYASKWDCHFGTGKLHRAFSVFLFNQRNEILLQQRATSKLTFPDYWANACCSHPLRNEEALRSEDAYEAHVRLSAVRRTRFELGIPEHAYSDAEAAKLQFITRIHYEARHSEPLDESWVEKEIDYIVIQRNVPDDLPIEMNRNEVQQVRWFSREQLDKFVHDAPQNKVLISPWFNLIYRHFLASWWDNLQRLETVTDRRTVHRLNV